MPVSRDYRDLNTIKLFTRINGVLVNETPLRIGTGGENLLEAPVDIAVYRVSDVPVIPGSSLKGALRQLAESILASKGHEAHDPWDFEKMEEEMKNGNVCVICGLFGSTRLASHVKIFDARPLDPGKARTFTKTGVAINREFGGAWGGLLYTEELVVPNVEWDFKMDIINIRVFREADPSDERASLLRGMMWGEMMS